MRRSLGAFFAPCGAASALRLGEHLRVTGLIDMSLGQTAHGVLVVAAGVGGVQDIHYVQLGKAGGHGAVAEQTLVGGHIQHMVGQLCHLGGVTNNISQSGSDSRVASVVINRISSISPVACRLFTVFSTCSFPA